MTEVIPTPQELAQKKFEELQLELDAISVDDFVQLNIDIKNTGEEWNNFIKESDLIESLSQVGFYIQRQNVRCKKWNFTFKIELGEENNSADFSNAIFKNSLSWFGWLRGFHEENLLQDRKIICNFTSFEEGIILGGSYKVASFNRAKFLDGWADFSDGLGNYATRFLNSAEFYGAQFGCPAYFSEVIFEGDAFFSGAKFKNSQPVNFRNSTFKKRAMFDGVEFDGTILTLDGSQFEGIAHFSQKKKVVVDGPYVGGGVKISADYAIFESPALFDLNFSECPDFSKTRFLKGVIIEDSWPTIDDSEIKSDDEGKFRFLKNYFAGIGNHFKEQQYFSYEMKAVECRKKERRPKKLFSKERWELRLFRYYKIHSNYGLSITRPLKGMSISLMFGFIFCLGLDCDPSHSFAVSFKRTFFPLSDALLYCVDKQALATFVLAVQSILNSILLFLLLLGIRNKFKIK